MRPYYSFLGRINALHFFFSCQAEKAGEFRVLQEQVEENERLLRESQKSWDDKLKEAQRAADERTRAMTRMGLECCDSDAK